jgi:hypothetical protein
LRAWLNLRHADSDRARAFAKGLERMGYSVVHGITASPADGDLMCTWSRIGHADYAARMFDERGLPVLVVENSIWGNGFCGGRWLTMARSYHNTAGMFPVGGPDRWDALGVDLEPWRTEGETVILPSRGIGPAQVAMPRGWPYGIKGRVRLHPGQKQAKDLREDLAKAGKVITWGSGAAVMALMWGIPVESHMPKWIAKQDNTDAGRIEMFRRLAWAQWTLQEIETGEAFEWLLQSSASPITA